MEIIYIVSEKIIQRKNVKNNEVGTLRLGAELMIAEKKCNQ
jgi:hypothetical protein